MEISLSGNMVVVKDDNGSLLWAGPKNLHQVIPAKGVPGTSDGTIWLLKVHEDYKIPEWDVVASELTDDQGAVVTNINEALTLLGGFFF